MKQIYRILDIILFVILTGGVSGIFLNIGNYGATRLVNIIQLGLCLIMVFRLINLKRICINNYAIIISLILISILGISLINSQNITISMEQTIYVIIIIIYAYLIYNVYSPNEFLTLLQITFFFIILTSFFISIMLPQFFTYYDNVYFTQVWRGSFTHKNTLGNMSAFYILILILNKRNKWSCFRLFQFIIGIITLLCAKSHTPIYILLICLCYIYIKRRLNKEIIGLITPLIFFVNYIIIFKVNVLQKVLISFNIESTLSGRIGIYNIVLNIIRERLYFGYGLGTAWRSESLTYNNIYNYIGFNPNSSHNSYLEFALNIGIIGMGIFIIILISIFYSAVYKYINDKITNNLVVLILFLVLMSSFESTLINLNHIYGLTLFYIFFSMTNLKKRNFYIGRRKMINA